MKLEDYFKYYIQGSDHYLIPKDVFKELFNEMINWKEESQKQKEVIEEVRKVIRDSHVEVLKYHDEPSETTSYEIVTVELLQILDKAKDSDD